MNPNTSRCIPRANFRSSVSWCLWSRWNLRQHVTVGRAEQKLAILSSLDPKAFFVNASVVPTTEQDQIPQRRGSALSPVFDVMGLAERKITAREATTVVSIGERSA
jgi:hypothetical protein